MRRRYRLVNQASMHGRSHKECRTFLAHVLQSELIGTEKNTTATPIMRSSVDIMQSRVLNVNGALGVSFLLVAASTPGSFVATM